MTIKNTLKSTLLRVYDQRLRFNDLSQHKSMQQKSSIMQFYSANANIGNYTPVLGIQKMLGTAPDTWNVHASPVDFGYINRNYKVAIIGGAGLLHGCFERFWRDFDENCKIPFIVWGIGGCFLKVNKNSVVPRSSASSVLNRAALVNVRDSVTAEYYDIQRAHVSACPTIEWVSSFRKSNLGKHILYASHTELVPESDQRKIYNKLKDNAESFIYTDNIQRPMAGLMYMIRKLYAESNIVITTRLHGAIIAYGLGVPYIGISYDNKLEAFNKEYGGGFVTDDCEEAINLIDVARSCGDPGNGEAFKEVQKFGMRAKSWVGSEE